MVPEIRHCPDCGVNPGQIHEAGCDVARCKECGWQELQCDECPPDREGTTWTGRWPGEEECEELGLYSYWGPPWIECDKDHEGAGADLNALAILHARGELVWNKEKEKLEPVGK